MPALLPVIAAGPAAASFSSCVAGLQEAVVRAGVSRSLASRALDIAQPDEKVLRLSEVQPEFKAPIWDYLGFLVDEKPVADGRAMMRQYDPIRRAVERRFGIDRHVISAVWGVETDFGREAGDNYLPHALATLVCEGGPAQEFLARRADRRLEARRGWRFPARPALWLLGRRLRADAVHPLHRSAPGRRFRRRRAARPRPLGR